MGLCSLDLDEGIICDQGALQPRSWRRNCLRLRGFSASILTKELSMAKGFSTSILTKGLFGFSTSILMKGKQGDFQLWNRCCLWPRGFLTSILTKELSATKGVFNLQSWWKVCLWPRGFSNLILMKGNQGAFQPRNWSSLRPRGFSTLILMKEMSATNGPFNLYLVEGTVCDQRAFQPWS